MWIFTLWEVGHLPLLPGWLSYRLIFYRKGWKVIDRWQDIKARERECVWRECRWHRSRHLELLLLLFAGYFWPECDSESMLYPWQLGPGAKSKQGCTSYTCCMAKTITAISWTYNKESENIFFCWASFLLITSHFTLSWEAQWGEGALIKPESKWLTWSL